MQRIRHFFCLRLPDEDKKSMAQVVRISDIVPDDHKRVGCGQQLAFEIIIKSQECYRIQAADCVPAVPLILIQLKENILKKITLAVMAIVGLVGATTAFADDEGWYVFGAAGQTTGDNDQSTLDNALSSVKATGFSSSLSTPTVYNLDVGYKFIDYLAIEGGYIGSTDETYSASGGNISSPVNASAHIRGWTLDAVGIWSLDTQSSLLGKLGVAGIQDKATVTGPGGSASLSGTKTDLTYGLGAERDFANDVLVRLDWDSYMVGDSASSSRGGVWTLGVGYKF